ncbi:MAG: integrase family protein [Alphaproteobacteria bacterium]|nr:integrase family protein [Alphaproteobacteria bacterium]
MSRIGISLIKTLEYKDKTYRVWDESLKGFGIVVQKDSKSFIIQYRNKYGRQKYLTLGRVGKIAPDEARRLAEKKFADITYEQDPAAQRQEDKNTMSVDEMCDWYMREGTGHKRESTISHNRSAIDRHIKPLIGHLSIKEVNSEIVTGLVRDIECGDKIRRKEKSEKLRGRIYVKGGKSAASHTLAFLVTIFEYAIKHGKLEKNPARGIKRAPDNKKEVFLTIDEIRGFGGLLAYHKVQKDHKTAINPIKLILLTGCRKGEIASLKWDYIDWEKQCFYFPITKTTGKQVRPFGKGALELLQELRRRRDNKSPFVFPATRESKDGHLTGSGLYKALKAILNVRDDNNSLIFQKANFDIHALRHTFASMGEYMGYSPLVIGALLGHKSKGVGITGRYIHFVDKSLIAAADDISLSFKEALAGTSTENLKGESQCQNLSDVPLNKPASGLPSIGSH